MSLLDRINLPDDLKKLRKKELAALSEEIREKIIATVKENGGHLSSNLGIVETTVAINYVFDLNKDKVIYDVGHQCYAHKLLTGRNDVFNTLRKKDGISGFPVREESPYDIFTTGHAGSSVSQGLGCAVARDLTGDDYYVINVIGDGSVVNGMAIEALASSRVKPNKYIVILNDNGMSISPNDNALYKALSSATVSDGYLKTKRFAKKFLAKGFRKFLKKVRGATKRLFNPFNFIEKVGFKYIGIIDGNDINAMVTTLSRIKNINKPVFLHIRTVKGKGYSEAENRADTYHGIGKDMQVSENTFSDIAGETLCKFAAKDKRIYAVTAGMTAGTGLCEYSTLFPKRFKDVGISEEHAVTYAAGLAASGMRPVVCIYSTFLQRAYDQIMQDVCIDKLPVIFFVDRNGLSGSDGKTHQGIFTVSYLRHIPSITVLSPIDRNQFAEMFEYALRLNSPVAILYPNGKSEGEITFAEKKPLPEWSVIRDGTDIALLAFGRRSVKIALDVARKLPYSAAVIDVTAVKPLDEKTLNLIKRMKIVTLEENVIAGGFGSAVLEYYASRNISARVINVGINDVFVPHATVAEQQANLGLSAESIYGKVLDLFKNV